VQVVPQVRPVALSAAVAAAPVPKAEQASRYPKAAAIMVATAMNSQIDVGLKAQCSGGTDGGMDASGNQCNQRLPADIDVHSQVAAAH
jgi:hypothetical protein